MNMVDQRVRRRQDREPEARLRWERGTDWQPAVRAVHDAEVPSVPWLLILGTLAFALVMLLLANGCPPPPLPPVVDPSQPDGGAEAGDSSPCGRACARLEQLGCPEAKPTPKGTTCSEVCENAVAEGIKLDTDCIERATACSDVNDKCR